MNESKNITRKRIAENLAGAGFALLWRNTPTLETIAERRKFARKGPSLDTPVAVVGSKLQERGVPSWLRLSRDGIGHIKASGRGIAPQDLRLVQKAVDGDTVYRQSEREWATFVSDAEGKLWMVGWKVTRSGKAAWLSTIHRSTPKQLRLVEKRSKQIKGGQE